MAGQVQVGDDVLAADINQLLGKPRVRLVQAVVQTGIASNTVTPATFTTEVMDTHNFHDPVTNNSRITPTIPGTYRFDGGVAFGGQADYTALEAFIAVNGTGLPPAGRIQPSATSTTLVVVTGSVIVDMNGTTDYAELRFRHVRSGAGTAATVISSQFATVFQCELVAPA